MIKKITEKVKEHILAIAASAFLLNACSIIYLIKYPCLMLVKFALVVGILDGLCACAFLIAMGVKLSKEFSE